MSSSQPAVILLPPAASLGQGGLTSTMPKGVKRTLSDPDDPDEQEPRQIRDSRCGLCRQILATTGTPRPASPSAHTRLSAELVLTFPRRPHLSQSNVPSVARTTSALCLCLCAPLAQILIAQDRHLESSIRQGEGAATGFGPTFGSGAADTQ
jgi:hypothetical protein